MDTTKPLHIFKPGRQIAMSGEALEFSEADLSASARAYDPAKHEAPIVIGHPRQDAPAYGWVKSLGVGADGLMAAAHQVDAAFAELVDAGRYKKVSASFYLPDAANNPVPGVYYLRHVGFLGAQPPAVKGLKPVEFGENEPGTIEFSDWGMQTNASLWRRMREWIISKFDQETADQVVPNWEIEALREAAAQDDVPTRAAFSEPLPTPAASLSNPEVSPVTPAEKAALEAENAQLKTDLQQAQAANAAVATAKRRADSVAYAEDLIGQGRLAPKHKDAVVAFLNFSEGDATLEFGEGEAKQPLAGAFKAFLGDLPKVVDFSEAATKDKVSQRQPSNTAEFSEKATDPDRLGLHVRAQELAAEKNIPYELAARQLVGQ